MGEVVLLDHLAGEVPEENPVNLVLKFYKLLGFFDQIQKLF